MFSDLRVHLIYKQCVSKHDNCNILYYYIILLIGQNYLRLGTDLHRHHRKDLTHSRTGVRQFQPSWSRFVGEDSELCLP